MSFRLSSIETRIVEHPLCESRIIVSPGGRHDVSRYLALGIRDCDGVTGYGEAATTALWSGETADTAQFVIDRLFAPLVLNATFDHPSEALTVMDKAAYANPFAKGALDTAIWDLWAKSKNRRASDLFGDRAPLAWVPTRASIGCYDVTETVRIATEFRDMGIRTLKFKVGMPQYDDAARLRAVRDALGEKPVFTVDANGAYCTLEDAVHAIEVLAPYNIAVFEQPTPRDRIHLMGEVKKRVSTPIMADECIFTPDDLREALDCDACDIVSLYPGKNGGLTNSIAMANMTMQAGKPCAIGCNLETDLGQAALIALAASLSAFPAQDMLCDLPAALFYQNSSVNEPLELREGRVKVPNGKGFGVTPRCFV